MLRAAFRVFPFPLQGDAIIGSSDTDCEISCIINFYGRIDLLYGILYSLAGQEFPSSRFEVILVEDRGGTEEGKWIGKQFMPLMNIKYYALSENYGVMGYARNFGLSKSKGRFVLFLDDDTVILQHDFLSQLIAEFKTTGTDCIVPFGSASYYLLRGRYGYHEPYYPTNRCTAYRRESFDDLRGFVSQIIGQEDVEFFVRFTLAGKRVVRSEKLNYYHPPLIVNNYSKAASVGYSFTRLRTRYPFAIWLMLMVNGSRFIPLFLFPGSIKWRMQAKFSAGFLLGAYYSLIGRRTDYA
jgi:GT2 family glycosyltransferase